MRKAKELTREMLEQQGVSYISENGLHIIRNGKECKQHNIHTNSSQDYRIFKEYLIVNIGSLGGLLVHRVVYAWFKEKTPSDMDIDHIDHIPINNHINNLRCLSHEENIKNKVEWWRTDLLNI